MGREPESGVDAYELLFKAVCTGTADDVIRQANRLFGLPVLFVDEYFHVVSMHPDASFGSAEWDGILERKAMDRDRAWRTLDEYLSGAKDFYEPFFADKGACEDRPKLFAELVKDGAVLGHVIVFWYGDGPGAEDYALMAMVLDALRVKAEGRTRVMSRWNMTLTAKLQDLLDPATPARVKRLAVEGISSTLMKEYAIIVAPVGELASHRAFGEYAVYELARAFHNVVSLVSGDVIVALAGELKRPAGTGSMRPPTDGFVGRLLQFFESHNMICGVSNCFTDAADTYAHYRQALLAARLAVSMRSDKSAVFLDLMPLPIFHAVRQADDPVTFVHPAIYQMERYDGENGTDYRRTMEVYSLTMHNRDKTAARLKIHRNTLLYRLNRIAELFDLPYEDEAVALNLLCSFLLLGASPNEIPE